MAVPFSHRYLGDGLRFRRVRRFDGLGRGRSADRALGTAAAFAMTRLGDLSKAEEVKSILLYMLPENLTCTKKKWTLKLTNHISF